MGASGCNMGLLLFSAGDSSFKYGYRRMSCLFVLLFLLLSSASTEHEEPKFKVYDLLGSGSKMYRISKVENEWLQEICGITEEQEKRGTRHRIRAGFAAERGQFPWAVSMTLAWDPYNLCSGTIISRRHIITSAHCFYTNAKDYCSKKRIDPNISYFCYRYGGVCLRSEGRCKSPDQKISLIGRFAISEGYKKTCATASDIAIVELEEDLEFDSNTRPICLPHAGFDSTAASDLVIAGFGRYEALKPSPGLNWMPYKSISKENGYLKMSHYFDSFKKTYSRPCAGDSGSGIQGTFKDERSYLLGVHKSGVANCTSSRSSTAVNIAYYISAICRTTGVCP